MTKTSSRQQADTNSDVFLEMRGTKTNSTRLHLDNANVDDFPINSTGTFIITNVEDIGDVETLKISLEGTDDWLVETIILTNLQSLKVYTFENQEQQWLNSQLGCAVFKSVSDGK